VAVGSTEVAVGFSGVFSSTGAWVAGAWVGASWVELPGMAHATEINTSMIRGINNFCFTVTSLNINGYEHHFNIYLEAGEKYELYCLVCI